VGIGPNSNQEGKMANVKAIPAGYHALTPALCVNEGARAIDFYKKALGATELHRMEAPGGKIMHAELKVGDSPFMLSDEFPGAATKSPKSIGGTSVNLYVYTEDCDALFKRAVEAGATAKMPPTDMFWGDRFGQFIDPFGHSWSVATHKEDVAPDEIKRRGEIEMKKMAQQHTQQAQG
jgi:PhnB protein